MSGAAGAPLIEATVIMGDFVIRPQSVSDFVPLGRALGTVLEADKKTFQRACIAYARQMHKPGMRHALSA